MGLASGASSRQVGATTISTRPAPASSSRNVRALDVRVMGRPLDQQGPVATADVAPMRKTVPDAEVPWRQKPDPPLFTSTPDVWPAVGA